MFKNLFLGLVLFSLLNVVRADLPYFPLEFQLTTASENYYEGDKIDFILKIKNTDKRNTYPILTPGNMTSGYKLIYLRVYDPDTKVFILRAIESRELSINSKGLGNYGIVQLGPEQEMSINFSWNDSVNFMNSVEAHHSFDQPIFAGTYLFQAFYNPFGNAIGDTLYHLMNDTEEEQVAGKLNFLGPALSMPCKVILKKKNTGVIRVDNTSYWSDVYGEGESGGGLYYLKTDWDKYGRVANCLREVSIDFNTWSVYSEVNHTYHGKGPYLGNLARKNQLIFRNGNGKVIEYSLSDEGKCPEIYFSRRYQLINDTAILYQQVDTLFDGTIKTIDYNGGGGILSEKFESVDFYRVVTLTYVYKNGILITKKKTIKGHKSKKRRRGPCLVVLL